MLCNLFRDNIKEKGRKEEREEKTKEERREGEKEKEASGKRRERGGGDWETETRGKRRERGGGDWETEREGIIQFCVILTIYLRIINLKREKIYFGIKVWKFLTRND